jgi:hypothetical protein
MGVFGVLKQAYRNTHTHTYIYIYISELNSHKVTLELYKYHVPNFIKSSLRYTYV